MVGGYTPGSSRRCGNCARRRKKCDLQRPQCGPCRRIGLTCSGPKSALPTFVNNTSGSFHSQTQRQALKNAYKTRETLTDATVSSVPSSVQFYEATTHNIRLLQAALARYESKSLLRSSLAGVLAAKYTTRSTYSALLDDFDPRKEIGIFGADRVKPPSLKHYSNVSTCIRALMPLSGLSVSLLDRALFSLLCLYYGLLHGNAGLVQLARSSYTATLSCYSKQLENSLSVSKDRDSAAYGVLVCASIALQFLEHLNDVEVHGSGHLAHIDGALSMLKEFGPTMVNSSASLRTAFSGFRGVVVFVAVERRAPSFLAEPAWLHAPWVSAPKTMKDHLIDIGILIPAEIHYIDNLVAKAERGDLNPASVVDLSLRQLNRISILDRQLNEWLYQLKIETEGPLYWPRLDVPHMANVQVDAECEPKYSNDFHHLVFSCGPIAGMLAHFWTFQLELLLARFELHETIIRCCEKENCALPSARSVTLKSLQEDRADADRIAQLILQTEPRLSSCFEGLLCIQAPLRVLGRYFEYRQDEKRLLKVPKEIQQADEVG